MVLRTITTCVVLWSLTVFVALSAEDSSKKTAAEPAAKTGWKMLCDGKSLKDWAVTKFGGEGAVKSENGAIVLQQGADITGINWTGEALPKKNYEVALEAERLDGNDFFCGLVFPVGNDYCSFVVGGWGGGVVGLSSVDGQYADDNPTTTYTAFDDKRWYKIRLRVGEKRIQAWIDSKQVVDLDTTGKKISVHPAVELLKPLGVACYATVAGLRNIRIRDLTKEEAVEAPPK
jgi:hypothetical protein